MTAFAASGLFASLVANRYVRVRYADVELDRRVESTREMRRLLEDLAILLPERYRSISPPQDQSMFSGQKRSSDVERIAVNLMIGTRECLEDLGKVSFEEVPAFLPIVPTHWSIVQYMGLGERLETRFSFVSDAELMYSTDRLDVKTAALASDVEKFRELSAIDRYVAALDDLTGALSAATGVAQWLVAAPNRTMRAQVLEGVRNSAA